MKNNRAGRVKQIVYGGLCGVLNGFFGSGGGILAVEAMRKEGVEQKHAHASSLLVILPLSAVSGFVYFLTGNASFEQNTVWLLLGATMGGLLGAFVLGRLNNAFINWFFTVVIVASGVRMLFS